MTRIPIYNCHCNILLKLKYLMMQWENTQGEHPIINLRIKSSENLNKKPVNYSRLLLVNKNKDSILKMFSFFSISFCVVVVIFTDEKNNVADSYFILKYHIYIIFMQIYQILMIGQLIIGQLISIKY